MKRYLPLIFALATALPLAAAETTPQPPQQKPEDVSTYVENVEVRVVSIDVVVTDKKDKPVIGLTKDDFVIFDNGQQKPISNFYEVVERKVVDRNAPKAAEGEPEPQAPPVSDRALQRRYIFFIDNLSLAPFNRKPIFKEMQKFIDTTLVEGDQAMIATFNRDLKIRVPFTNDHTYLKQTLDIIAEENAFGLQNLAERRSAESQIKDAKTYEEALGTARTYAYSVENDLRQAVNSMKSLMTTLAGVDGKKVMVIASEGLQIQPGRELFFYIDDIAPSKEWRSKSSVMLEATHFDSHGLIQSVAQTANANGVTLYTLHAGGLGASGASTSAENQQATTPIVSNAALTNSQESLRMLAGMTGGVATTGTNNFGGAFDRIASDVNSYYSLGYRSGVERVDRQRSIDVRAKNKNYKVRSRKSFVEKSLYTEISDKVIANVFYDSNQNDLGIMVITGQARAAGDERFTLPMEIRVPMDNLAFIPTAAGLRGGFSVFIVTADDNGDMSDVQQQQHPLTLTEEQQKESKGKFYTYSVDLLMRKGRNRISVAVVDDATKQIGYATREVLATDLR
ncbi:MAG: VWA domain-containing protein [Thermoanaerobaculia bacterium]